jgi:hypothetical protein
MSFFELDAGMSGDDAEQERRGEDVLKRLLATPPDHRRNVKSDANPKKRGRPTKVKNEDRGKD